jgi:hypothetical protein
MLKPNCTDKNSEIIHGSQILYVILTWATYRVKCVSVTDFHLKNNLELNKFMDAIFVYLFKVVNILRGGGILSLAIAQHNIIKKLEAIFVYLSTIYKSQS